MEEFTLLGMHELQIFMLLLYEVKTALREEHGHP
jgi:hypothetical protein